MSIETPERTTTPTRLGLNLDKSTWTQVRFGEVIQNVTERVDDPSVAGVERYVGLEHLDPGVMTVQRWDSPDKVAAQKLRFQPGDVIFGRRRAYQKKVAKAEFEGICSAHALVLRAKSEIVHPDFLPVFLSSDYFLERAISISVGSLSPTVNWRDLKVQEFILPPLDEQKRLADLLRSLEDHRQSLSEFLEKSHNAQGRLIDRLYRDQALTTLGAWVARIEAGRSPSASSEPAMPGELGVLKVSAVGGRKFLPDENKRLHSMRQFREDRAVRAGDLLITRANAQVENVARACIVQADYPNLMLSDKSLRLVPREGLPVRVILAVLRASVYRTYVHEVVNGTEAKNISQKRILAGPVPDVAPNVLATLNQMLLLLDSGDEAVLGELHQLSILRGALLGEIFEEDD